MAQSEKKNWLKDGFKIAILGLFTVCGLLYAQQNNIIAAQSETIKENKIEVCQKLEKKVDNKVLLKMIEIINIKQNRDAEHWVEQKEFNKEMVTNIKELNENIIKLNER